MTTTVLVIDDSMVIRAEAEATLKEAGYSVITAVDGIDGLTKLNEHPEVNFVFCDINMPRMTGIEFLDALAKREQATVPVVMLTTEDKQELIAQAKARGARGWVVKPLKADILLAAAKKLG